MLSGEEIDAQRAGVPRAGVMIISTRERTELRFNGEWLGKLSLRGGRPAARTATVARMLERDDFAKRFAAQAADLRLGAPVPAHAGATTRWRSRPTSSSAAPTSSTTCSLGREVMEAYGLEPQVALTVAASS